jgi:hypothetical protein
MLNPEQFLRIDMLGERQLQQLAAPLHEKAVSLILHDLTLAVQEHDMDDVAVIFDTLMTGLQSMTAIAHDAMDSDVVDAADFRNRILLLLRGDKQPAILNTTFSTIKPNIVGV